MDGAGSSAAAGGIVLSAPAPEGGDWHMGDLNPAAAATGEGGVLGDWRRQLDPTARHRIVSVMLEALKKHLPMSNPAGRSRLQDIAVGIENNSYTAATDKSSYFKNIALMMLYVESPYQNQHRPAPGLPPKGNNPAHSSASILMSQQKTQHINTSASVQSSSSLSSSGQGSTDVSQTSPLQNMYGRSISAITQMQPMAIQSAMQRGIQHNPLNKTQQHVNQQQRHPHPSLIQQSSLQHTQRTQQLNIPLQQQIMSQEPNLHQNELICQQNSAVEMQEQRLKVIQSNNILNQQQISQWSLNKLSMSLQPRDLNYIGMPLVNAENFSSLGFASLNPPSATQGLAIHHRTSASEAGNPRVALASASREAQAVPSENNADREDESGLNPMIDRGTADKSELSVPSENIVLPEATFSTADPFVPEPRMTEFRPDDDKDISFVKEQNKLDSCFLDSTDWVEQHNWDAVQAPPVSDTQMENYDAEQDDWCFTARLAASEDPNYIFMAYMETNPKKRKYDGSSSSSA